MFGMKRSGKITHSSGCTLLLRLADTLSATLGATLVGTLPDDVLAAARLAALYAAACAAWLVAGNHPLLVIPSASKSRARMSSVMTSRCSIAASRESSFADVQ